MADLTSRQSEILKFIRDAVEKTGMPPTRAEICEHFGFSSPNAAEEHLRALARKGVIEMLPGASRGIRLIGRTVRQHVRSLTLPLIGRVAAGSPILAVEHVETHYNIDPDLFSPRADYLLRVRGLSMRDANILDGDLLAVHRTDEARSGQIIVARVDDDEVTVKRLRRQGAARLQLLAENPQFKAIEVDLRRQQFAIEGLAVGVLRVGL